MPRVMSYLAINMHDNQLAILNQTKSNGIVNTNVVISEKLYKGGQIVRRRMKITIRVLAGIVHARLSHSILAAAQRSLSTLVSRQLDYPSSTW